MAIVFGGFIVAELLLRRFPLHESRRNNWLDIAAFSPAALGTFGNFWMESERKLAHVYSFRTSSISCHESIFTLPESISFRRF